MFENAFDEAGGGVYRAVAKDGSYVWLREVVDYSRGRTQYTSATISIVVDGDVFL